MALRLRHRCHVVVRRSNRGDSPPGPRCRDRSRLTCFNSDLPSRLPFGNERGDFTLESGGPIREIVALVKPTHVVQPPLGGPQLWRLISQLSLSYLSLTGRTISTRSEKFFGCMTSPGRPGGEAADRGHP